MRKKLVKVGLKEGTGPRPGYRWSVDYLSIAADEAEKFLTEVEYGHVVDHIRALAGEENPTRPKTVSVDLIGDVHELRIKGGPLQKKNVRVFFFVAPERRIVVLGCKKKESEGSLPPAVTKLMSIRRRKFLAGDYQSSY